MNLSKTTFFFFTTFLFSSFSVLAQNSGTVVESPVPTFDESIVEVIQPRLEEETPAPDGVPTPEVIEGEVYIPTTPPVPSVAPEEDLLSIPTPTVTAEQVITLIPEETVSPVELPKELPIEIPTPTDDAPAKVTETPTQTPAVEMTCSSIMEVPQSVLLAFPEAKGFGAYAFGGSGRHLKVPCTKIHKVTNLNDSGEGSLRECVAAEGPRTCVFEVAGMIWANKELRVVHPFLTIAGQTAPSPGITIRGSGMSIETSDVVLSHLKFRVGDDPQDMCCETNTCAPEVALWCTSDPGARDGVRVWSRTQDVQNVMIDHVSISWALDEGFSITADQGTVRNVTFSNSIVSSGLDESLHPGAADPFDVGHSKAVLIHGAMGVDGFSFVDNLLAHNADRNIRATTSLRMEMINNLIYDWGRGKGTGRTIELSNTFFVNHFIDLVGNVYAPGPDTFCPETQYQSAFCFYNNNDGVDSPAERLKMHYILRVGSFPTGNLNFLSRYHLSDNIGPTRPSTFDPEWNIADPGSFRPKRSTILYYPEVLALESVSSSGSIAPLTSADVPAYILTHAGARPTDRDSIDAQVVSDVMTSTGRIINCVAPDGSIRCEKNAGGWPIIPTNHRALILPEDPAGIDTRSGYTNLEQWLFGFGSAANEHRY